MLLNFELHTLHNLPITCGLLLIFYETIELVPVVIELKLLIVFSFLDLAKIYVWYKHLSQQISPQKSQDLNITFSSLNSFSQIIHCVFFNPFKFLIGSTYLVRENKGSPASK